MMRDKPWKNAIGFISSRTSPMARCTLVLRAIWHEGCGNIVKGVYKGFSQKYGLKQLVYYEDYGSVEDAIRREKILKKWHRNWKIDLIKRFNSTWADLYDPLRKRVIPEFQALRSTA